MLWGFEGTFLICLLYFRLYRHLSNKSQLYHTYSKYIESTVITRELISLDIHIMLDTNPRIAPDQSKCIVATIYSRIVHP